MFSELFSDYLYSRITNSLTFPKCYLIFIILFNTPSSNIPTSISVFLKYCGRILFYVIIMFTIYFHRMNTHRISQSMWVCLCVNEGECYIDGPNSRDISNIIHVLNLWILFWRNISDSCWLIEFWCSFLYLSIWYWGWACKVILANMGLFLQFYILWSKYHHFKRRNCFLKESEWIAA